MVRRVLGLLFFTVSLCAMQSSVKPLLFTGFRAGFFEQRARDFVQQNPVASENTQEFLDELALYMKKCGRLLLSDLAQETDVAKPDFYSDTLAIELDPKFVENSARAFEDVGPLIVAFAQWNFKNHGYILKDLLGCCVHKTLYDRADLRCITEKEFDTLAVRFRNQVPLLVLANTFEFALAISREFLPQRALPDNKKEQPKMLSLED